MFKRNDVLMCSLMMFFGLASTAQAASSVPPACLGVAESQGGGAGGGNGGFDEEIKFRETLLKIDRFLHTKTGADAFPQVNTEDFHAVATNLNIFMKNGEVRDDLGNARTCAWNTRTCTIVCDRDKYAGLLTGTVATLVGVAAGPAVPFVMAAHEVFALMKIEPGTEDSPSSYAVSIGLVSFVREVMSYDLTAQGERSSQRDVGMTCVDRKNGSSLFGFKKKTALIIDPQGQATLWELHEPHNADWYLSQDCSPRTAPECIAWTKKREKLVKMGLVPKAIKIAEGQLTTFISNEGSGPHPVTSRRVFLTPVGRARKGTFGFRADFDVSLDEPANYRANAVNSAVLYSSKSNFEYIDGNELMTLRCSRGDEISGSESAFNLKMRNGKVVDQFGNDWSPGYQPGLVEWKEKP